MGCYDILQNATQHNDPAVCQSEDAYGIQQKDIQQNDTWQNDKWQNANKKITRKVIRKTLKKLKLSEQRNKIGMFLKFFFRYQQYAFITTPKSCLDKCKCHKLCRKKWCLHYDENRAKLDIQKIFFVL